MVQGNTDGSIFFRSIDDGSFLKQISPHSAAINYLGFNSTGRLLISTSANGQIRIFDFFQNKIIHRLESSNYEGIRFALFSIADGFIYFNGKGRLYKTRSDLTQEVLKIYDFTDSISAGVITDDRSALIISLGKYIYVINTRTDETVQQLYAGNSPVEKLVLVPGGKLMSWSSDGAIQIWNIALGQLQSPPLSWFKAGPPGNISFSHDGNLMMTGNIGNWARLWKPMEKSVEQELFGHQAAVTCFAFSHDDQTIFTASNDQTIRIWKKAPPSALGGIVAESPPKEIALIETLPPKVPESLPPKADGGAEMTSQNIPVLVRGRKVKRAQNISVKNETLDLFVFDNEIIDGDTLSLFFNGEWILKDYGVIREKRKITIQLKPNTNNYLVLFAENLGTIPPNTAAIQFSPDGTQSRTVRLSSDLTLCRAINFIYKK
jgi:WD40 repeat protein